MAATVNIGSVSDRVAPGNYLLYHCGTVVGTGIVPSPPTEFPLGLVQFAAVSGARSRDRQLLALQR